MINDFVKRIKKHGVKIAIDDFGSGYANFEHIIGIDADFIKIDGSLIKNIATDRNARIITEAIISFSKKLGRKTITEYVSSEEIYEIVKDLGQITPKVFTLEHLLQSFIDSILFFYIQR